MNAIVTSSNSSNDKAMPVGHSDNGGSCRSFISGIVSKTIKIAATVVADLAIVVPLVIAVGKSGTALEDLGFIDATTAKSLDGKGYDFSVTNPLVLSFAEICKQYIAFPIKTVGNQLFQYDPKIRIDGHNVSGVLIAGALEEIVYRGLIQRVALPLISKGLPKRCGDVLNHQVTRIALTSLIFALSHTYYLSDPPLGVTPQFLGGVLWGIAAELDNGLFVPIMAHGLSNLVLGMGKAL